MSQYFCLLLYLSLSSEEGAGVVTILFEVQKPIHVCCWMQRTGLCYATVNCRFIMLNVFPPNCVSGILQVDLLSLRKKPLHCGSSEHTGDLIKKLLPCWRSVW